MSSSKKSTGLKHIALLGSTGSIGRNVLDVVRQFPDRFRIVGLAAGTNISLLYDQIKAFDPLKVAVGDEGLAGDLVQSLPPGWGDKITVGRRGNEQVATLPEADTVVSAIVGAAGLTPTYAAIRAGKDIALANKETLVMAGAIVMAAVRRNNVRLLPIDSEHNAIAQALTAGRRQDVRRIILTASGGPFRTKSAEELWHVTPEESLAHPNWDMGNKISVDSATLMNKGLEVIEARWLFDIEVDKIEVLIHPQSIVHSMVEFIDGSIISQMGIPDMRIPIIYALAYPERLRLGLPPLDLPQCRDLHFEPPDFGRFPALQLAYQACKRGGSLPAVLNAANEVAVAAFLAGKIRFPEIVQVVARSVNRLPGRKADTIDSVIEADLAARKEAEAVIEALGTHTGQQKKTKACGPGLSSGTRPLS